MKTFLFTEYSELIFFKDDYGNMYVAAIHEKTNTLMASKINEDNMIKLGPALKPGFDSEMIAKLQKDDLTFALVFQPTANLARSKSYGGCRGDYRPRVSCFEPTLQRI